MRVLHVIHGYPPSYNAGSEIYAQALAHVLVASHEVHVFTREEDPSAPDGRLRRDTDVLDDRVRLHVVNVARPRDRYRNDAVDVVFESVLEEFHPDIVHVGHLNHLSTSLIEKAAARRIPIVYTLHDYWIMCPRGQFVRMEGAEPWSLCSEQDDQTCATSCYQRYFSGAADERDRDVAYWTDWVRCRMAHVRSMVDLIDVFLAPSRTVLERFRSWRTIPDAKLRFLPYGFDHERLSNRQRHAGEPFTFGYIGTHIPQKGVALLIRAFASVPAPARLRIWGHSDGQATASLKRLAASLESQIADRIEWRGPYASHDIVRHVFDHIDAIVVPSIWIENAPLVIHEAQQARVPVITADEGGMAELVRHLENGLLFRHRDKDALARSMIELASDSRLAAQLGSRGYLASPTGNVPSMRDHAIELSVIYSEQVRRRNSLSIQKLAGPWRITFDTNPDDCNLRCIMCEEHSPYSDRQTQRRARGDAPRRMDVGLIRRVVREAKPHGLREIIPSTMGEPLLYAEFDEILAICRDEGVKLNLTTNGTFPRLGARAWAQRIVPVASDVKVSWNGANSTTHESVMLGSSFDTAVQNLREFLEVRDEVVQEGGNRCRVTLQLTFLETNVSELAEVVRFAAEIGVDRVKGHHLWAHFDQIEHLSMRRSPDAIGRWNRAVEAARQAAETHRRPDGSCVVLENIHSLQLSGGQDIAPRGACPFLGREAWVNAQGRFDPCCAPDVQRRTLGSFGSLRDQELIAVWNGDAYQHLVATYRNRPLCIGCNMRRPTEGEA